MIVMSKKISENFDTAKSSAAVFVIYEDTLLLNRYKFQGLWCCGAVLGKFVKGDENQIKELVKLEKEQLGIELTPRFICTNVSYINKPKPDGRVRLTSQIYLLDISADTKNEIKKDKQQRWMNIEEINKSKEIREDDKVIFANVLTGKNSDLVLDVDQMGMWGKAKLISWEELR